MLSYLLWFWLHPISWKPLIVNLRFPWGRINCASRLQHQLWARSFQTNVQLYRFQTCQSPKYISKFIYAWTYMNWLMHTYVLGMCTDLLLYSFSYHLLCIKICKEIVLNTYRLSPIGFVSLKTPDWHTIEEKKK